MRLLSTLELSKAMKQESAEVTLARGKAIAFVVGFAVIFLNVVECSWQEARWDKHARDASGVFETHWQSVMHLGGGMMITNRGPAPPKIVYGDFDISFTTNADVWTDAYPTNATVINP